MLAPQEFSIGLIGSVESLTLVLPRDKYDQTFLIVPSTNNPVAVFLSGEHQFLAFESSGNESYKGILVPSVTIELDVTSVGTASFPSPGAMVRREDGLFVAARPDRMKGASLFAIERNLVACGREMAADFSRWTVTLGTGRDRRTLWTVDLAAKTNAAAISSPV